MPLPDPHPGLVISFSYLWRHEARRGRVEGTKDRPAVIVLTTREISGARIVTVAPITHRPPGEETPAIELPPKIKEHLGLDDAPSWVVLDETNEFIWPGHDLRPRPGKRGVYTYGILPQKFFVRIAQRITELWDEGNEPVKR